MRVKIGGSNPHTRGPLAPEMRARFQKKKKKKWILKSRSQVSTGPCQLIGTALNAFNDNR